ncbi:hypothetical protein B0H17DRAFT_1106916 [Mycena rosella]|uniref:Uncharacterized protein n=1 Tax=Mycena rosella TaxID=1033263 RepID=A0AAD7FU38_MYCRO|nr:hypothetical protein B0H17DRAFT_1106916 [Mycena rosella]
MVRVHAIKASERSIAMIQRLMQRLWVITLLLSVARATLKNYTVDDQSLDIVYSQQTFTCPSALCPENATEGLFNGTATVTTGAVAFQFTGSALYLFLTLLGDWSFTLDGNLVDEWNFTIPDAVPSGLPAYNNLSMSMPDGPHNLVIAPVDNTTFTLIGIDYFIYTANAPRKTHVGAIVGGVIGGLVLSVGLSGAAFVLRRREQRKRLSRRGIPLGDQDAASIRLGHMHMSKPS